MPKKKKTSSKIGRPTKYKPEYPKRLIEYFDKPLYYTETEERMSASGAIKEVRVKCPTAMPTFEGFAHEIGVIHETLREWCNFHDEFSAAYKRCKGLQKKFIIHHGITGGYNANFAKFVAINCTDMIDKSEVKNENETTVKGYGLAFNLGKHPDEVE